MLSEVGGQEHSGSGRIGGMRVLHLGNLCNNSYKLAKFQRRLGVDARLRIYSSQIGTNDDPAWEDPELKNAYPSWIEIKEIETRPLTRRAARVARVLLRGMPREEGIDILHAQCMAPVEGQFRAPGRLVSHCLGSDLREMATSRAFYGYLLRRAYRHSRIVFFNNIDHIDYLSRLGLNGHFLPNPMDLDRVKPQPRTVSFDGYNFVVFHPARLDWTYRGNKRSSTKGNDRLIKAFARFAKHNSGALLVMLKSGVDYEATAELVNQLGIGENVRFIDRLTKDKVLTYLNSADVIADQFDVGAFGGSALEALACGRPLITYLKEDAARRCYGEVPPIFNCGTVDEIDEALWRAADSDRAAIGDQSRAWIERHHNWEPVTRRVLDLYDATFAR